VKGDSKQVAIVKSEITLKSWQLT